MRHIQQTELEELRQALEVEKEEVEEELASHGRVIDEDGEWQGATDTPDGQESDPLDVANNIEELVTNVPLVEELEERHHDIVDALEKIENGTYGLCEASGEPIPFERLKANPAARTKIEHAEDEGSEV